MLKKVVLVTGNEHRHKFFSSFLNNFPGIKLLLTVHENSGIDKSIIKNKDIKNHFDLRMKNEKKYFKSYLSKNNSKILKIKKGEINNNYVVDRINENNYDFIIFYGCSIIKKEIIRKFFNIKLNIHLGLSPYYKGAGTNFFSFTNNEIHFCGSTIMTLSKKVDDGKIIHQLRPNISLGDNIHEIGNMIIKRTASDLCKIITFEKKIKFYNFKSKYKTKYFKKKDFNIKSLKKTLKNFDLYKIEYVLFKKIEMEKKYPIIKHV